MSKKMKPSDADQVIQYLQKLEPELANVVEILRQEILNADPEISEHIKWNSLAMYYTGAMEAFDPKEYKRDLVVFNLHRGHILLIFPTGDKIKDESGLLEGNFTDGRRIITIKDLNDATEKAGSLQEVVRKWLALVEK